MSERKKLNKENCGLGSIEYVCVDCGSRNMEGEQLQGVMLLHCLDCEARKRESLGSETLAELP